MAMGCRMINFPPTFGPTSSPRSSTTAASTPKNGNVALPGFGRDRARQRRDHDGAGFRLPPGIDDRAAPAADRSRDTTSMPRD